MFTHYIILHVYAVLNNKRPRGLDACQQHCKISATDVSENVYLCSKMNYNEKEICIGLYTRYYVFISYPSCPYYMFDPHNLLILHSEVLHLMKNV